MTGKGGQRRPPGFSPTAVIPLYLEPAEAEEKKQDRARRLHVVDVPATRLVGFLTLLVLVYLHNRFVLGSFSWGAYLRLAGGLLGWALLGWLLLHLLYERLGTRLAFTFLFGDIAMLALVVYATGGEKSWLFFILVVRSADVAFVSWRQLMTFAHVSVLAYIVLLAWVGGVESRSLEWPTEAVKIVALWLVGLYLAFTGRVVEVLRAQTSAAVRAARDLARRLEVAWRHAEMLSAAKSQFLASISHELRTPLNAIIGSAHLIHDTGLTAEQKRYFAAIGVSAQGLLYSVNQILDFLRVEAGTINLEPIAFSVREALEAVVQLLGIRAEERGLDLTYCVADDVPNALVGDAGRLHQVLINLVDNGLKFTERGGVTMCVRVVARRPDGVSLRFEVTDTGVGISPEDQTLIFEAFAQASMSGARTHGGTGLGLAIASELVRRLGGQLEVESEPGRGSTFHFTIDCALRESDGAGNPPAQATTARMPEAPASAIGATLEDVRPADSDARRRLQTLVVEDDPLNAELMRAALERRGHTVVIATTGPEAIAAFDRAVFDVVLMDIRLPGVDGLATAAAFRDRERRGRCRTRIVAVTGSVTSGERERCLAAGIDAYLAKPVDQETLFSAVEAFPREEKWAFRADFDREAGARIARLFLTEAPRQLGDVGAAIARRDHAALVWAAHRLKGAIGNFPATGALDAAEHLEGMAGRDDVVTDATWVALEEQFARLQSAVAELLEKIQRVE